MAEVVRSRRKESCGAVQGACSVPFIRLNEDVDGLGMDGSPLGANDAKTFQIYGPDPVTFINHFCIFDPSLAQLSSSWLVCFKHHSVVYTPTSRCDDADGSVIVRRLTILAQHPSIKINDVSYSAAQPLPSRLAHNCGDSIGWDITPKRSPNLDGGNPEESCRRRCTVRVKESCCRRRYPANRYIEA